MKFLTGQFLKHIPYSWEEGIMSALHRKRPVHALKGTVVATLKLIRVRDSLSECKDRIHIAGSRKRLQASAMGVVCSTNALQNARADNKRCISSTGKERISGKSVSAGNPFGLVKWMQQFVPLNFARSCKTFAVTLLIAVISNLSFNSDASGEIRILWAHGFDETPVNYRFRFGLGKHLYAVVSDSEKAYH